MIYYTGDIHGVPWKICQFCKKIKPTADDVIVILGDVAAFFAYQKAFNILFKSLFRLIHEFHLVAFFLNYTRSQLLW